MEKINSYLQNLHEGYLFSDKTISVNLDKFESGANKNLLIVGNAGSGKTTLAAYLSKKYKVQFIGTDQMYKLLRDQEIEKKDMFKKITEMIMHYIRSVKNRVIVEGANISQVYVAFPKTRLAIINTPMIILGDSAIKAGIKAGIRNYKNQSRKYKKWMELHRMIFSNFHAYQKPLNMLRKDVKKLKDVTIKQYKIPRL